MHKRGRVVPTGLNLRETPGGIIKDQLAHGDDVTIFGKSPNNHWLHILHHKTQQRGWVAAMFIKDFSPTEVAKEDDTAFADTFIGWMYGGGIALAIVLVIIVALIIRWFS